MTLTCYGALEIVGVIIIINEVKFLWVLFCYLLYVLRITRYLTAACRLICNVVPCLQVTICRTGSGDLSCLKQPEVNVNTGVSIIAFCRLTLSERLVWYRHCSAVDWYRLRVRVNNRWIDVTSPPTVPLYCVWWSIDIDLLSRSAGEPPRHRTLPWLKNFLK